MTKRILVVEDNDLNRKLFCDVLRAGGFSVEPVADGNVALERARLFLPNLVVMDIQLQDISGLDLIASMKRDAQLCEVPVLAVTAYAGKGDEERLDESADINNLAYDIRSIFGADAQNEFLQTVSTPSQPGKNTNECKFARGHNRKTMAAVAQEIRQKYKPSPEWKPSYSRKSNN